MIPIHFSDGRQQFTYYVEEKIFFEYLEAINVRLDPSTFSGNLNADITDVQKLAEIIDQLQLQQGKDGKDGKDGQKGERGEQGKDGRDGKDGENGKDGEQGKPGLDGQDGKDGKDGLPGMDGLDGKDGEHGKDGAPGLDGLDGQKGLKGDQGEKGDKGDQGERGIKGERGIQGVKGEQGEQGKDGKDGKDGEKGERGERGKKGEKGDKGERGVPGRDGASGGGGGGGSGGGTSVSLDANADTLLSLSAQTLGLDTQTANTILAGPNGSTGIPTFRTLEVADVPGAIPIVTSDPVSPTDDQAWVLKTDYPIGGQPIGLSLVFTQSTSYYRRQISVRDNGITHRTDIGNSEYQSKNSSYTLTINDGLVEFSSASDVVATLSTPYIDKRWDVKNSGAGSVQVNTSGGATIDGQASGAIILTQYENLSVKYNGTNFVIL